MKEEKLMKVSAIKNGTAIDHIPSQSLFKVISILNLQELETPVTFGNNLESKRLGKKAIIKISDTYFRDEDINKIALVAPQAKLNIIKDYNVVEKKLVEVPDEITGIVKCFNPKCITNHEKITTRFTVLSKEHVLLQCYYCEKIMYPENFEINKN